MDKFWMIVNVSGGRILPGSKNSMRYIPDAQRPHVVHTDEEAAKQELIRLQSKSPGNVFILMEAVAVAAPKPVVTYTIQSLEYPVPF